MKIVVAIKQVPARDSQLRIASSGKWIEDSDLSYEINEPDAYALEEGLQLKEKNGGEVVALCAGPARAAQTIREALAKGADPAIHIEEENLGAYGPLGAAKLLAAALKPEKPDLVLTGLQSDDLGYGQTGVILAELLGLRPTSPSCMQMVACGGGPVVPPGDAGLAVPRSSDCKPVSTRSGFSGFRAAAGSFAAPADRSPRFLPRCGWLDGPLGQGLADGCAARAGPAHKAAPAAVFSFSCRPSWGVGVRLIS